MRRLLRWTTRSLLALIFLALALLAVGWLLLRASLPQLDGQLPIAGIRGSVQIERDALGVVTISADRLEDAATGIGFAHGQDRFFQMDLSRRLAAGELAGLVGAVALPQDRKTRIFGFRALAREVIAKATPDERAAVAAYTRGVNAGLTSLGSRPWEYWLLRQQPQPWRDEDSVLAIYAMWWNLQGNDLDRERDRLGVTARLAELAAMQPDGDAGSVEEVIHFLYARGTEWDAPNFQTRAAADAAGVPMPPSLPGPERLDLRKLPAALARTAARLMPAEPTLPSWIDVLSGAQQPDELRAMAGSNNWAVAGAHTATGAALIANDMHLGLRVPAVWYRARIRVREAGLELNGVTLPGAGSLVAGSNGHISWGFTNSYGDWADLAVVSCNLDKNTYDTDAGVREFQRHTERIEVKGGAAEALEVRQSSLGVLVGTIDSGRRCLLARWLATNPDATNLRMLSFNVAKTLQEALALAPQVGIPHQNLVVGDREGHIAWSLIGRVPGQEMGVSAAPPLSWRDATTQPHLVDPEAGRIWTANARVVDGDDEKIIGSDEAVTGAGYGLGARARQIRDDLLALQSPATPADMLRIQLDDRALFLDRWRRLLMGVLDEDALHNMPQRAELRRLVDQWDARADAASVGYRLVREFHAQTEKATFEMFVRAIGLDPAEIAEPPQFEGALWRLVTEQPVHLLSPDQGSWRAFLLAQADRTISRLRESCAALDRCAWGEKNRLRIRHPLSGALGPLARFLDMPDLPMSGDHDMPRVQGPGFGASERFAVSPGHEDQAYLELPGGQSGHPMSPYYRAGFDAWVRGEPTPFLPGTTQHSLTLGSPKLP